MKRKAAKLTNLKIAELQAHERLRVRGTIDPKIKGDYFAGVHDGWPNADEWPFPAIEVRRIDSVLYVVDGWYRIQVAKQSGMDEIPGNVIDATWPEAILAAAVANAKHGIPLTASERRRAVHMVLLIDAGLSDRSVADLIGVSPGTVSTVRNELVEAGEIEEGDERKGADGKRYPVNQRLNSIKKTPGLSKRLDPDCDGVFRPSEINGTGGQVSKMDTWNPTEPDELTDISQLTETDEMTDIREPDEWAEADEPFEPAEVQMIVARFRRSAHRGEILAGIVGALTDAEKTMMCGMLKNHFLKLLNQKEGRKSKKVNPTAVSNRELLNSFSRVNS